MTTHRKPLTAALAALALLSAAPGAQAGGTRHLGTSHPAARTSPDRRCAHHPACRVRVPSRFSLGHRD